MQKCSASVSEIRFSSESSGFAVVKFRPTSGESFFGVGTLASLRVGESVDLTGEFVRDPKWGEQFRVYEFEYRTESTLDEIEYMLGSGLFEGLGKKRASDIVNYFGRETINVLDNSPKRLSEVPGIGKKRADMIAKSWEKKQRARELMLFLKPYGVSLNLVNKIQRLYGDKAKSLLSENPYRLIHDMSGVGFKTADTIAQNIGYDSNSYRRLGAALHHILRESQRNGHIYLCRDQLLAEGRDLTGGTPEALLYSLDFLAGESIFVIEDERVYISSIHKEEVETAQILLQRIKAHSSKKLSAHAEKELIGWAEDRCNRRGIEVNEIQLEALICSQRESIMLLTGGPGTGKTTTVKLIVDRFYEEGKRIVLAAPTGRAAQKLAEVTEHEGKTIHRLLEYNFTGGEGVFQRDRDNPISADVLIVDEFSMVDLSLFHSLLLALPKDAHLILVGDSDQLPSVGAGKVLADCLSVPRFPHVSLTKIFRQAEESRIVTSAHEIRRGSIPRFSNSSTENCFFLRMKDPEKIFSTVVELVCDRIPTAYNLSPEKDIQVLTAMHKGILGTASLNTTLQATLNRASGSAMTIGERRFSVGDKVMQTANNYEKQIFNGDIGFVVSARADEITVAFPQIVVTLEREEAFQLTHAYCITIHKSQGSEFPVVVIPILDEQYIMLRRNLLYTAVTRAKQLCVIVGTESAFSRAVKNGEDGRRNSHLSQRVEMEL